MAKPETSPHLDRLINLLPHYVAGVIWCFDFIIILALATTFHNALRFASRLSQLAAPFHFPDFAIALFLVPIGVIAPYAFARALNPLGDILLNLAMRLLRFYEVSAPSITSEHYEIVRLRIRQMFSVPPPLSAWSDLLMQYLIHIDSPTARELDVRDLAIHERGRLIFPVALLVGIIVYCCVSQRGLAWALAVLVSAGVAVFLIESANTSFQRWNEAVILAFLAVTGVSSVPLPEAEMSPIETNTVVSKSPPPRSG
jgi:hypothetical protein